MSMCVVPAGQSQKLDTKCFNFTLKNRQERKSLQLLYKVNLPSLDMRLIVDGGCGRHKDRIGDKKSLSRPWRSAILSGSNKRQDLDGCHVSSKEGCRIDCKSFFIVQPYI